MYSLDDYGQMIADDARTHAYAEAIAKAVRRGDVAVDIGCAVGVFALLACRAGARRVYAIESSAILEWGKRLAAANGFSDRIVFLRGDSRQIDLPERVNVVISDLRGALPFFGDAIDSIQDARQRFLAPGGIQIPQRDTLFAAIADAAKSYEAITAPWRNHLHGLNFSALLPAVLNSTHNAQVEESSLLTQPQKWCTLEYSASPSKRASASLLFRTNRRGTAHGIWLWFETQLFEDVGFTTGPQERNSVYGRFFLPWPEPVALDDGEEISVELHADSAAGSYIWRWNTKFGGRNGQAERCFRQSTFESAQFSHAELQRRSTGFVPALTQLGMAHGWILQAMDGKTPLGEIARAAALRFPQVFRGENHALCVAAELSEKFSG